MWGMVVGGVRVRKSRIDFKGKGVHSLCFQVIGNVDRLVHHATSPFVYIYKKRRKISTKRKTHSFSRARLARPS